MTTRSSAVRMAPATGSAGGCWVVPLAGPWSVPVPCCTDVPLAPVATRWTLRLLMRTRGCADFFFLGVLGFAMALPSVVPGCPRPARDENGLTHVQRR